MGGPGGNPGRSRTTSSKRRESGRCAPHVGRPPVTLPCTRTRRSTDASYSVTNLPLLPSLERKSAVTSWLVCSRSHGTAFAGHSLGSAARHDRRLDAHRRARRLGGGGVGDRPPDRRDRRHPALGVRRLQGLHVGRSDRVSAGVFSTPRPVPGRLAPTLAGGTVIALALPVFAIAGWPLTGWALAGALFAAGQGAEAGLTRLP